MLFLVSKFQDTRQGLKANSRSYLTCTVAHTCTQTDAHRHRQTDKDRVRQTDIKTSINRHTIKSKTLEQSRHDICQNFYATAVLGARIYAKNA